MHEGLKHLGLIVAVLITAAKIEDVLLKLEDILIKAQQIIDQMRR